MPSTATLMVNGRVPNSSGITWCVSPFSGRDRRLLGFFIRFLLVDIVADILPVSAPPLGRQLVERDVVGPAEQAHPCCRLLDTGVVCRIVRFVDVHRWHEHQAWSSHVSTTVIWTSLR